ncbi:MAG: hypothetical protein JO316_15685 [Abitibacteriaceae bacterium]|nr:hypothetical protein [Abditibacteriaceae bacterium]
MPAATGAGCGIIAGMEWIASVVIGLMAVLCVVPFAVGLINVIGDFYYGTKWLDNWAMQKRAAKAREIDQHSITVEESDSGGYQVVD